MTLRDTHNEVTTDEKDRLAKDYGWHVYHFGGFEAFMKEHGDTFSKAGGYKTVNLAWNLKRFFGLVLLGRRDVTS